jgi:hypothetical protein
MKNKFDEYHEFKGYRVLLTTFDEITRVFTLTEDEFNNKKDLLNWLEFLVKTEQWIPFALYHDLFGINKNMYKGLEDIDKFKIQKMEVVEKYKNINLDLL